MTQYITVIHDGATTVTTTLSTKDNDLSIIPTGHSDKNTDIQNNDLSDVEWTTAAIFSVSEDRAIIYVTTTVMYDGGTTATTIIHDGATTVIQNTQQQQKHQLQQPIPHPHSPPPSYECSLIPTYE